MIKDKQPPHHTSLRAFRGVTDARLKKLLEDKRFRPVVELIAARRAKPNTFPATLMGMKTAILAAGYSDMEFTAALAVLNESVARPE